MYKNDRYQQERAFQSLLIISIAHTYFIYTFYTESVKKLLKLEHNLPNSVTISFDIRALWSFFEVFYNSETSSDKLANLEQVMLFPSRN